MQLDNDLLGAGIDVAGIAGDLFEVVALRGFGKLEEGRIGTGMIDRACTMGSDMARYSSRLAREIPSAVRPMKTTGTRGLAFCRKSQDQTRQRAQSSLPHSIFVGGVYTGNLFFSARLLIYMLAVWRLEQRVSIVVRVLDTRPGRIEKRQPRLLLHEWLDLQ